MTRFARLLGTRRRLVILSAASLALLTAALLAVQAAGGARSKSDHRDTAMTRSVVRAHSEHRATQGGADITNQPALVADAVDAQSAAGSAYYANAVLHDASNTIDLYLAGAPQSLIDRLNALHPGVYVIHNDAANPRSALLHLENSIDIAALRSQGVSISSLVPTSRGYLQVGVTSDVAAATAKLNSLYDPSLLRVVKETDGSALLDLTVTGPTRHPRAAHP